MCGILGSINYDLPDKTVQLTRHRGPDGFGTKKVVVGDHSIQLFHHRLAIVDLSINGTQPMSSTDDLGIIVFNGEIYNHKELLDGLPYENFRGHSDTETLVNFCRKECSQISLTQVNGIFSFAYLDIPGKKLYLARDRFGVKPLYYYFEGNRVLFSSELRSIVAEVGQRFSIGSITTALNFRIVPAPATLFKDIYKVEPGQLITISLDETLSLSKGYFADLPRKTRLKKGTMKQLVSEYGQLLEKAVERQLLSDVEVGVFLSGGVDSSLIAAIAKSKMKNIKAFTVGFNDKELDERAGASKTAALLGMEHYTEEIKFGNFFKEFEHIVNILEQPVDSGSPFAMYTLSKLTASKVKVVLSGQGADEPLGGYTKYKALPMLGFLAGTKMPLRYLHFCSKYVRHKSLRRILSSAGTSNNVSSYFEFNSLFDDHALHELMNERQADLISSNYRLSYDAYRTILQNRTNLPNRRDDLFPYLDTRAKLPETLLNYTDKITMHFGLECRVPMLDNDLVEFIESLPRSYKFNFWQRKIIHKKFALDYLPEEIINRKKLAFHGPSKAYLRNKSKEVKEWLGNNDNHLFWEIFDRRKIFQIIDEHAQFGNRERELILLISLVFLTDSKSNIPAN